MLLTHILTHVFVGPLRNVFQRSNRLLCLTSKIMSTQNHPNPKPYDCRIKCSVSLLNHICPFSSLQMNVLMVLDLSIVCKDDL